MIDYTARIKGGGAFETTREADAREHGIHDPDARYAPRVVSVGEPNFPVLRGLDEALAAASAGDRLDVDVEPAKAFGERDAGKVRMIPLRKLGEDAEKASVGDVIEIDGRRCTVRFIGSGRVQVDYNHRYAGKTLSYDVEVKKALESDSDRIAAILEDRLPPGRTSFSVGEAGVDVEIPGAISRMDGLQGMKNLAKSDAFKFVPSLRRVRFVETHENPAARPRPAAPPAPAAGAAAPAQAAGDAPAAAP